MRLLKLSRIKLMSGLLILAALANFVSTACSIRKPQSPSWLTTWDIPLINRVYLIPELLDNIDNDGIVFDSAGNPGFEIARQMDTIRVDDNLQIDGIQMALRDSIGIISVPPPNDISAVTYLDDIISIDLGFLPPASLIFSQPLPTFDNFTWVDVRTGAIDLTFFNAFEVDLDTFLVTVIDSADLHIIGTLSYDNGLSYLETETRSLDISGQRISNRMFLSYQLHTPGGVLINAGPQSLQVTASFNNNIQVSAARARINEITVRESQEYAIEDSTRVLQAIISQGMLRCEIKNYSELIFTVTLHSPNFTIDDREFTTSQILPANSQTTIQIDLAGYTLIPNNGPEYGMVRFDMTNYVPGSDSIQYTIDCRDSLSVVADIADIQFVSITGQIKPTPITVDPVTEEVELPDGLDQAFLTHAAIDLNLYNNTTVPVDLDLRISGGNKTMNLTGRLAPKLTLDSPPQLTVLSLGPDQTAQFLSPPPTDITISGQSVINPDYAVATIRMSDSFFGDMLISSPFSLAITDTISITPEISHTTIDDDSRPDDFRETAKFGRIEATLSNHLPLGAAVTIFIGARSDSTLYDDPATLTLGPYRLESAVVGPDGRVSDQIQSLVADSLTSDQLSIFDNDTLYFGQKVSLFPTGPSGVSVSHDDFMGILANARLQIKVGDNIWGNK